jgi:R67 dihydrofolate reductase
MTTNTPVTAPTMLDECSCEVYCDCDAGMRASTAAGREEAMAFGQTEENRALDKINSRNVRKFRKAQRVRKIKGSSWQGRVVGSYSTKLTPIGYCVESEREPGSVQIYPESALEAVDE